MVVMVPEGAYSFMYNYRLLDVNVSEGSMTVDYGDGVYLHMPIPRSGDQWLSGSDLDRYVYLQHPNQRTPAGVTAEDLTAYSSDREFVSLSSTGPQPSSLPTLIEDSVIEYKQSQFMAMVEANRFPGGPWLFTTEGSHVWHVPQDLPWVRIVIFSSGRSTWAEGPGMCWSAGCRVPVGETVQIELGQTTVVSSSLGTVTVNSGWDAVGQRPEALYKTLAWGHVGRTGAVIIY
jgi:hypothetical protein